MKRKYKPPVIEEWRAVIWAVIAYVLGAVVALIVVALNGFHQ